MTSGPTRLFTVAIAAVMMLLVAPRAGAQSAFITPPINLLYQNFPNPFPNIGVPATCIWFDLAQNSTGVTVAVYDLRGRLVRTIVPSAKIGSTLSAGYYGRNGNGPAASGCDPRLTWDGRGSNGASVPAGVYLLRLHVDDAWQTKKMIFRGP